MLTGFGYGQDHVINNSGSSLSDHIMLFVVHTEAGVSNDNVIYLGNHSDPTLKDLRFTNLADQVYEYCIDSVSNPFDVFVKIPSVPNGNSTIRVQYGNSSANAVSSKDNTVPLWDDFEVHTGEHEVAGSKSDKWTDVSQYGGWIYIIVNDKYNGEHSQLCRSNLAGNTYAYGAIRTAATFVNPGRIRIRRKEPNVDAKTTMVLLDASNNILSSVAPPDSLSWTEYTWDVRSYRGTPVRLELRGGTVRDGFGYGVMFDDVITYSYATPEPTHSTWGTEISYFGSFTAMYDIIRDTTPVSGTLTAMYNINMSTAFVAQYNINRVKKSKSYTCPGGSKQ